MLPAAIRKLSCNPVVRGVAHHLHVTHFARRVYCRLLASNGELQVSCLGVDAVFKTRNSKQLAFVDYILTTERSIIEATLCDLKAGDTFLDVGCHYGIFSVLASKLVGPKGRVIAVEPHPESLQVLGENLAVNRCQNVYVLEVAFSDTTGPLALAYDVNFAVLARESDPAAAVHKAQGMAGDEALRNIPVPNAVKIDVEGHEFAVLRGLQQTLSNPACRRVGLEVHPGLLPSGISQANIVSLFRDCGLNVQSESARSGAVHLVVARDGTR
jgi:FkbM family methyltransferase